MSIPRLTQTIALAALIAALVSLGVSLAAAHIGPAAPELTSAPTVVSYQGRMNASGSAFNGVGFFKFALVNAAGTTSYWSNDGTSVAGSQPSALVPVSVTTGLFTVMLGDTTLSGMSSPLSAALFSGPDRRLRIWFSSTGLSFDQLSPDQRLGAVPFALNAETLDGLDSAAFALLSHTHKAADIITGTLADARLSANVVISGQGVSRLVNDAGYQKKYAHVKIVAKSGGDFTSIQSALDSISDNSASSRYLIWVAPGTYTETVTMKSYVDIEGAGELQTKIIYTGSNGSSGTVNGAGNTELRFLTVENVGGDTYAIALYNPARVLHVTAMAAGGSTDNYAVYSYYASPTLTAVNLSATQAGTTIGTYAYGVRSINSSVTLVDSTVSAYGGYFATGAGTNLSTLTIARSTIRAAGGNESDGIFVYGYSGTYTTTVHDSQIFATNFTVRNDDGASTPSFIAVSQMAGGGTVGSNITCAGVYDENYAFYASSCP
jgi:hypothetical protein